MPRGGYRKGSGQKRKNLYRVSVGVTQEMKDKGLLDAGDIQEAALKANKYKCALEEVSKDIGCGYLGESNYCHECRRHDDCELFEFTVYAKMEKVLEIHKNSVKQEAISSIDVQIDEVERVVKTIEGE